MANEIWDNFDIVKLKAFFRRLFQVMRDCCDAVRLYDAVASDWQVRTIGADQSNVRSVQRSYDGQIALRLERFARENATDGMRDGVVNVEQIQVLGFCNCGHFRGQR